jgi:cell division transport system ATP-binding protein
MIIFSSVTKQFGDHPPALDDVTFTIDEGELTVVTGPSGSGKTSLMRLLTKEYHPTSGEITFLNTPLSQIRASEIHHHRRKIGVVFQDYKLLHELNVWENIALALSIIGAPSLEIESRVTDLLKLVNLVDKAFLFPNQLSGGEAQRVSIARALSTAPKVIFADEPTGNLDPETSKSIVQLLQKINQLGTTIIITTHDPVVLETLTKARHLKLVNGKLVQDSDSKKKPTKSTKKHQESEIHTPESLDDEPDIPETNSEEIVVEISGLEDTSDSKNKKHDTQEKKATESKTEAKNESKDEAKVEPKSTKKRVTFNIPSFLPFGKKQPNKVDNKTPDKEPDHE